MADDSFHPVLRPEYQTTASPLHQALWDETFPSGGFAAEPQPLSPKLASGLAAWQSCLERHQANQTLCDAAGKISEGVFQELGTAGYWGLIVPEEYGGLGGSLRQLVQVVTQLATRQPTVAGMASIHGGIGAVTSLLTFGTAAQKSQWLPRLAQGTPLSAFALTEPAAGTDLTALGTTAVREGDHWVVSGEKLFITNLTGGRLINLVCMVDARPALLLVELPAEESEQFQLKRYPLHALKHSLNHGLILRGLRVPADQMLTSPKGDGLTIAYHGLNRGRMGVSALIAGTLRTMLANLLPWVEYRRTYGQAIGQRELVRGRLARLASLIVGCDAMANWCATLLDRGYRGEMECAIAKIFASEAQKEAAIEIFMRTHGGRSFLVGHEFGDHLHEYFAPCIYEGEGEMLSMGLFKSLAKAHGQELIQPMAKAMHAAGIQRLGLREMFQMRGVTFPYLKWKWRQRRLASRPVPLPQLSARFAALGQFAAQGLKGCALEMSLTMTRHGHHLVDRQGRMMELSRRVQDLTVLLCTAHYGSQHDNLTVAVAAEVLCQQLQRRLSGRRVSDGELRTQAELGERIIRGEFPGLEGIVPDPILMPYGTQ